MSKSAGRVSPEISGEINRNNQPEGVIMNANPKAAAAWGTDSSGEMVCCMVRNQFVPDQPATNPATTKSEITVVPSPVQRLIIEER